MSVDDSSPIRRRRTAEDARAEALAAARGLLLEKGPQGVTLKAVAAVVGVTHANLLHHFGSAGVLQSELMTMMVKELTDAMQAGVAKVRSGETGRGALVDLTFDTFGPGGAGHLAAWLVLNRETDHLEPIGAVVRDLARAITPAGTGGPVEKVILMSTMLAFADAVIGPYLRDMLGMDVDAAKDLAKQFSPEIWKL